MELIFKNNIEKLVLKNKFSLTKLSEMSGVSISTLSRIFSGKIKKPNQYTVNQIADFFKIPSHLLLTQDIEMEQNFEDETKHDSIKMRLMYLMKKHAIGTTDELAFMTDVPVTTIKSILQGESEKPQLETCSKLAEFFNITIAQFRCEDDLQDTSNQFSKMNTPVLSLANFEKWRENNYSHQFIKEFRLFQGQDKCSYFMIEVTENSHLGDFECGDILVFKKKTDLQASGRYLCKIKNEVNLFKIFIENNKVYYKDYGGKNKIECQFELIKCYGELIEVKIYNGDNEDFV